MNTRQHIQKKHPSQSTYTPVQNLYQTRAFDIQQQPSHSSSGQENVDLDADHEQSQYKLYNLPYIPVNAPGTEPPPPIQTQLNSGEPTNYYQQGSADVPWYNRPTYPNIPVNAPGTEPPPPIQTQLNSGEPTNYYQQGLADVPWYNRPTYPNIPVNAPGTEPPPPIQTKLTIGEPGDKYEQEADQVASQVVQQINSPVPVQSAQGQTVQREEVAPFEEEQVQAKSISDTIQRQEKPDLEASINQARGGGQAMGDNIRKPMEQAFGADFGGVKVHTDSRSDQLNQSIQARAFTTGQNVFFRQGEYNPGSRGGQELLAHELTHVVQQGKEKTKISTKGLSGYLIDRVIQRKPPDDPHQFTYQDKAGRVWFRDEDDKWYRPGDKQGEKIFWSEREDAKAEELIRAEMPLGSKECLNDQGILKNADKAVLDDNKFTKYALNTEHERGKEKAKVFESELGYTLNNWGDLKDKILNGLKSNKAKPRPSNQYGNSFRVDMNIEGVEGKTGKVRTVRTSWIVKEGIPNLVTLFVDI